MRFLIAHICKKAIVTVAAVVGISLAAAVPAAAQSATAAPAAGWWWYRRRSGGTDGIPRYSPRSHRWTPRPPSR